MKTYEREYSLFSLCGLNCGLCPHYQSESVSKCPGCGGNDFCLKHPSCSVIKCNEKHDNVEYCFQCSSYPCDKYKVISKVDSFITYQNVNRDLDKCSNMGVELYKKELSRKIDILEYLLKKYNNGRLKKFYCLAINLIEIEDLETIMKAIDIDIEKQDISINEKIELIIILFKTKAEEKNIILKLRKKSLLIASDT